MMKKLVSAPYLLWMAIFIIVPLIMVAYFALTDTNGAFTLDNLAAVSQYSNIFIRSIWLAAGRDGDMSYHSVSACTDTCQYG